MCGILGIFEVRPGGGRENTGRRMAAALAHRGPDDEGLWQDEEAGLLLGHRRLAILDLSPEGRQPMSSPGGRYVTVYNGEIYNYAETGRELAAAGAVFRGRSDTEVMLAAFDRWGVNQALQKMNGMFAFAVWDKQERQLHLVRDRLGKKPLYVGWAGGSLVFASELKALRAHPGFAARVNRGTLDLFMRYGFIPAPHSIYEGVWQLLPGCRMTVTAGTAPGADLTPLMEPYWHPARVLEEARQSPVTDEGEAVETFEAILKDCVRERMVSDVPLGAFLSGGIDSSLVAALMQQSSPRPVKTFTIGFREEGFDEAEHAKAVAAHLGTDHHELYLDPAQALEIVPRLPEIYDEPFADESQIPTFLVSRFAREHVTVALSGDGGDEMMAGYNRHVVASDYWRYIGWMPRPLRQAAADMIRRVPPDRWDAALRDIPQFGDKAYKMADLLPARGAHGLYARVLGRWDAADGVVIGGTAPPVTLDDPAWQPRGLRFAEKLVYDDTIFYLPHDVLAKVDRATMASSLEARAPLLDRRVFEYAWRLPMAMKVRRGRGKWLLRQVLARHVPEELFDRPKQGFSVPVGEWLCGPLRGWAEDLLNEDRMRQQGYLNPAPIRAAWDAHQAGYGGQARRLWAVLMFQSWLARWG